MIARYTVIEEDGNTHGVLFLNSNAQDVTLTPAPGLVYRTIGGIIDIYFFLGPDPEDVVSQYTEAVGRYYIPPYWSLGFHLCRLIKTLKLQYALKNEVPTFDKVGIQQPGEHEGRLAEDY